MGFNKNTWTNDYEGSPGLKLLGKVSPSQYNKPIKRKPTKDLKDV